MHLAGSSPSPSRGPTSDEAGTVPGPVEALRTLRTWAVLPGDLQRRRLHRQPEEWRPSPERPPPRARLAGPRAPVTLSQPGPGRSPPSLGGRSLLPLPPPSLPSPCAPSLGVGAGNPTPSHQPGGSDEPGSRWSPITVRWRGGRSAPARRGSQLALLAPGASDAHPD